MSNWGGNGITIQKKVKPLAHAVIYRGMNSYKITIMPPEVAPTPGTVAVGNAPDLVPTYTVTGTNSFGETEVTSKDNYTLIMFVEYYRDNLITGGGISLQEYLNNVYP